MKTSSLSFVAIAAALFAGSVCAAEPVATLDSIEGLVLVNQGEEFVTAEPGVALAAGDRVLVMVGAKAVARFADGCALPLSGGSMTTVPETSTCAGAVAQTERVGQMYAQAVGGGTAAASGGGMSTAFWVGAGLIVAGGTIAVASNNNGSPISQ